MGQNAEHATLSLVGPTHSFPFLLMLLDNHLFKRCQFALLGQTALLPDPIAPQPTDAHATSDIRRLPLNCSPEDPDRHRKAFGNLLEGLGRYAQSPDDATPPSLVWADPAGAENKEDLMHTFGVGPENIRLEPLCLTEVLEGLFFQNERESPRSWYVGATQLFPAAIEEMPSMPGTPPRAEGAVLLHLASPNLSRPGPRFELAGLFGPPLTSSEQWLEFFTTARRHRSNLFFQEPGPLFNLSTEMDHMDWQETALLNFGAPASQKLVWKLGHSGPVLGLYGVGAALEENASSMLVFGDERRSFVLGCAPL